MTIFEEGFRYYLLRRRPAFRAGRPALLSFGLGWGVGEALIVLVPALALLPLFPGAPPSALEVLPGVLERNLAIVGHVALTFIVLHAVTRGRGLLGLAIGLHFALNGAAVSVFLLTGDIVLGGIVVAGMVGLILVLAWRVSEGWSVPPVETPESPPEEARRPGE